MQHDDLHIEKLYYSIGEVADMFKVNTSLLRYWEKEFTMLHPKKNLKGERHYTKKDIEAFRVVYHLVKEKGFTLNGAKQYLKTNGKSIPPSDVKETTEVKEDNSHVKFALNRLKAFLIEMKGNL